MKNQNRLFFFIYQVFITSHTVDVKFYMDDSPPVGPPGPPMGLPGAPIGPPVTNREMFPIESSSGDVFPPSPPPSSPTSSAPVISAGFSTRGNPLRIRPYRRPSSEFEGLYFIYPYPGL